MYVNMNYYKCILLISITLRLCSAARSAFLLILISQMDPLIQNYFFLYFSLAHLLCSIETNAVYDANEQLEFFKLKIHSIHSKLSYGS